MNITCPQCGFSREVPPERMPRGAAIATCPKCSCRFRLLPNDQLNRPAEPACENGQEGEEQEDIRVTASRAYAAEAERFEREERHRQAIRGKAAGTNPWDSAPRPAGWLAAFYQTCIRVMFSAPGFFSTLKPDAAQTRALGFYLIIALIQTLVERFWSGFFISMLSSGAADDPQLQKMLELLGPQSNLAFALLLRCGMLAMQIYILSFLMYLAYRLIAPGRATFSLVFQIMAYSSAPALLCVVPIIGSLAGWIWSLACLVAGCRAALHLDWARAVCGLLPIVLLFAPVMAQVIALLRQ